MPTLGVTQFVRPNFDRATEYAHYYMGFAAEYAAEIMTVRDLAAVDATKSNILASLEADDPVFCYWNGHGNADTYSAQNKEVVMVTGEGDEVLIERVVLLLSCSCGINLAPSAVSKGATTIFAWVNDFTWIATSDPAQDIYAVGYFETVNVISNALVEGKTTGEAMSRSLASWNQWIDYWAASGDPYASLVIQWLIHDRDGQTLFGSTSATITVSPVMGGLGLLLLGLLLMEGGK